MLLKKTSVTPATPDRVEADQCGGFMAPYPALFEFITASKWDDGSARKLGTITLFFQDGRFKAWVNDKDRNFSACVTASSPDDLLLNIEAGLLGCSLDWRPARPSGTRRGG